MQLRRTIRIAGYLACGLIAVTGLLLVAVHTPPVKKLLLRRAIEALAQQDIGLEASSIDYNLLGLRVELRGVVIRSRRAPDLPPLLTASRIAVTLNRGRALRGAWYIEDAAIENPQVHLVVTADGRDNLLHPPPGKSSGSTDYLVRHLAISGGAVRFDDQARQITTFAPIESIVVAGDEATGNHRVALRGGEGGALTLAGRSLPLRGLAGDFVVEKDAAQISGLRLRFGDSDVAISGNIASFQTPGLDLRAEANLSLESVAAFAAVTQRPRGTLQVSLTSQGPLAQLRAAARIRGRELSIDRFDHLAVDLQATYDTAASVVRLDSLEASSPLTRLRASGELDLHTPPRESSLRFTAREVDLARLSDLFSFPVRIASAAAVEGRARWPGLQFERAGGNASIQISQAGRLARNVLPVDGAIAVTLAGNRIDAAIDRLNAGGATVAGAVSLLDRKTLSGEIRAQIPQLAGAITAAEWVLGKELANGVNGSLTGTARLAGTLQAPQAAVELQARDVSAGDLTGIAVDARANYAPDRVLIESAGLTWQNQAVQASGRVGLGERAPIELTAHGERISLPAVLAGLNRSDLPLAGILSLDAAVTGTTDSPNTSIRIDGVGLEAWHELLGSFALRARLHGRQLEVDQLDAGPIHATGSYDLDSTLYRFEATAREWRLSGLLLPDGTPVRGTINLAASGQGLPEDTAGNLKLTGADLQIGDKAIGSAEIAIQAANQQADVRASVPRFNLTVTGRSGLHEPYRTTAQVRLDRTDLARLPLQMEQPLAGVVSAVIDASGDLSDYTHGTAHAEVSELSVVFNGEPVRTEGPLVVGYANDTLAIERAVILAAGSRVEATGTLPLDNAAAAGQIRLSARLNLPGLARFAPDAKLDLSGDASLEGSIRGNLRRVEPDLSLALDNGRVASPGLSPAVTNARLRARTRDGALEIETLSASWGTAVFTASGAIPFGLLPAGLPVELPRRQGPATFSADLKAIDLSAIQGVPATLTGTVTVHLDAEAPKPELDSVKAVLTFPELKARVDRFEIQQEGVSEILLENGLAQVRRLHLTGAGTDLRAAGTAEVTGKQALQLQLDGSLDASLAAAFTDAVRARGATEFHAAVTGTASQPEAKGYLQMADGQLSLQDPRIGIEGLNLRIDLDGMRATLSRLEGQVNGGTLGGGGSIAFADGAIQEADLNLRADEIYMDFPAGLKTVSDLRLQLKNLENRIALRGSVVIKEGGFTDDLNFDRGILAAAMAPRSLDLTTERNRFLDSIRFNINIVTQDPILVENNVAKAEITAQLVVLGSPYEPGLAGRLVIEEGSELTLQERRYEVARGIITFTSDRRIEPNLDIEATTTASNYDITLRITGTPSDSKTVLTSNPVLPEPDILAILVTGKTLDEIRGQEFQVAQTQVLSYLTGRVGTTIGRQLEKATGLSRVRVEPNLIAAETNPGARLTVGQDITRQLQLVYSMDLVNSSDQIYIAEYDFTRRFVSRGVRQSDGSFRFDVRHDVRFGGTPPATRAKAVDRRIGAVTLTGTPFFPEPKVLDKLGVHPGNRYDFFKVRKGIDRVNRLYAQASLLESSVRLRREQKERTINLNLNIIPGPRLEFVFEGASVPGGIGKEIHRVWAAGVFDTQRVEDATGVLRRWLVDDRYLTPEITANITTPAAERKRVLFEIQRGPQYHGVAWVFDGARGIDGKRLRDVIEDQKLSTEVYTKPSRVTELLGQFYKEMGYLDASLDAPRYELDPAARTGRVVFPVKEGSLYRVGEAHFTGNRVFPASELLETAPLPQGEPYRPILRENATQRLREAYWSRGFNDAEIEVELQRNPGRPVVDLNFRITENARGVVAEITVEGNRATSEGMIRTQLELKPGDPVNLQKVGNSRRKLYNTGAFAMVDIAREDTGAPAANGDRRVRLRVKVQEVQPFELRYGGFFDTERGPGGILDFSNRNTLGSARVIGVRGRYDAQLREVRLYFSQPLLTRFPIKTIANPYLRREITPETDLVAGFNVDRLGISVQQEAAITQKILLNYGYHIERSHTYDTGPDPIFDVRLRLASLTATLTRDTRDELLDASKGSFLSHAFQFSPESLGSQVRFVKYFGQYFRYFPLQKPRVELFTNQVLRPRLVFASGVRLGLGTGLGGQEIPLSERFLAGGSTTLRGFEQNSVGGTRSGSTPLGGNGMLVLNNELRFPIFRLLDGVGFVDVGNVYPKVADFSLTDLRKDAGAGIRVRTPWFLLRLDYGFNLDRRPGESVGRLFVSIGQAF